MAETIHKSYTGSMIMLFLLGLILGGIAVVFALQNIEVITVVFFGWKLTGSLSFILLLSILVGILIALFIVLPKSMGDYFKYKRLLKENAKLTEELRKQKELTVFAKITPPSSENITMIEDEAISYPKLD